MIRWITLLSALLAAVLQGCREGDAADGAAIAELSSSAQELDLSPSSFADLDLELKPLRPLDENVEISLFIHLLDGKQRLVRTFDRQLDEGWPISGSIRISARLFLSALAEPPAAGEYSVTVGLFDPLIGRFAVETRNRRVGKQEYEVARVRIAEPKPEPTRIDFLKGWAEEELTPDLEVLRDRPLLPGRRGSLRLEPIDRPAEVWFQVQLPAPGLADEVQIHDGDRHARLRISSSCAPTFAEATGPGTHALSLRLTPVGTRRCTILFEANHVVRTADGRLVAPILRAVAWRSARS
ncbi:MAG: hypothetical protein U0X73_00650 [Thermoanaerobaculia bacterium]